MLGFGPLAVDNLAKPWREMQCGLLARKVRPCEFLPELFLHLTKWTKRTKNDR